MIDKGTFGSSKAAVILEEVLNNLNDAKITKRVSRILVNSFIGFKKIKQIEDPCFAKSVSILWRDHCLQTVNKTNYPPKVISTMCSLISSHYKIVLEEINENS